MIQGSSSGCKANRLLRSLQKKFDKNFKRGKVKERNGKKAKRKQAMGLMMKDLRKTLTDVEKKGVCLPGGAELEAALKMMNDMMKDYEKHEKVPTRMKPKYQKRIKSKLEVFEGREKGKGKGKGSGDYLFGKFFSIGKIGKFLPIIKAGIPIVGKLLKVSNFLRVHMVIFYK